MLGDKHVFPYTYSIRGFETAGAVEQCATCQARDGRFIFGAKVENNRVFARFDLLEVHARGFAAEDAKFFPWAAMYAAFALATIAFVACSPR